MNFYQYQVKGSQKVSDLPSVQNLDINNFNLILIPKKFLEEYYLEDLDEFKLIQ